MFGFTWTHLYEIWKPLQTRALTQRQGCAQVAGDVNSAFSSVTPVVQRFEENTILAVCTAVNMRCPTITTTMTKTDETRGA